MKRTIAIVAALCSALGFAVAALAMYAAWDHNPQGEFHELADDGTRLIHWGAWAAVGLVWFVVVVVPLFLIGGGATALSYRLCRRNSAGQSR
jgi:type VI protein secretion system component VasK